MTDLPTILIADDDAIFLGITAAMVKKMGYTVLTATDGIEAVEIFKNNSSTIGYVFLDIHMPKMSGISAFQHIRSLCQDVKVVMISGALNNEKREQLSPLRPTTCLNKPVSFELLLEVLSKSLDYPRFR